MRATITPELMAELSAAAAGQGCELLHAEFDHGALRLFLDHPEGVTLEHCERVSREASALLDVLDFGAGRYTLEVSSPGLDRKLYRPADYQRFLGCAVRVTFRTEETRKRTVKGHLSAFDARAGVATVTVADGGEVLALPLADIQLARLEIEL